MASITEESLLAVAQEHTTAASNAITSVAKKLANDQEEEDIGNSNAE